MQITWSSKASNDLTRLLTYTRDQRSISTARQRLTLIETALLRLAQWPDIGRRSDKKDIRVLYAPLDDNQRVSSNQQIDARLEKAFKLPRTAERNSNVHHRLGKRNAAGFQRAMQYRNLIVIDNRATAIEAVNQAEAYHTKGPHFSRPESAHAA